VLNVHAYIALDFRVSLFFLNLIKLPAVPMQASPNSLFEQKPFELGAWAILMVIGSIRILKDIVQDLFVNQPTLTNLSIDVPLLVVFLLLIFWVTRGKLKTMPLWVGLILLLLTTWSFVRLGGVAGSSEYNFMALGVMFTLCYKDRDLIIVIAALFAINVFVYVDQVQEGRITSLLFKARTDSYDSFYTSMTLICVVLLYFKEMLKVETSQVRHVRELLSTQRSLIRKQHEDLVRQQAVLFEATRRLHHDVQSYDDDIRGQNEAISNYIYLSTQNLRISMSRIKSIPSTFPNAGGLDVNLKEQIDALTLVVANLISDLEKPGDDHLN
jgi:hypothetical protein